MPRFKKSGEIISCENCKRLLLKIERQDTQKEKVIDIVKELIFTMNSDDKELRSILKILGVE